MKFSVLLTVWVSLVLTLVFTTAAQSHPGVTWHWSVGLAESKILNTIQAENALGADDVWDADCVGTGKWIWNDARTRKLYKHFECYFQYTDYDGQDWEWERVLHVLSAHRFALASV